MNKAANTYWDNSPPSWASRRSTVNRNKGRGPIARAKTNLIPTWVAVLIFVSMTVMLMLTINYRAFSVLNQESHANKDLEVQVQMKTDENLALQEEIHYLKNDSATIEREAKKFGFARPNSEKVSVPAK